ncbi:MAG: mechanosensitive ion channel family protein [Candidatus Eremiobacterota bacterium]
MKKIIISIIIFFICCFTLQLLMAQDKPVPYPSGYEPDNPSVSPSVSPSKKSSATRTPVVILPPLPVSTQIPLSADTPLPSPGEQWQMKRELFLRIKNEFYSKGIFIAFPQLTVWLNHDNSFKSIFSYFSLSEISKQY